MNQRIKELISKIAPSLALDELQNELEVSDTVQPHPFTCICDKCCATKPQEPVGYQELFDAIAAATSVACFPGINISIKDFTAKIGPLYTSTQPCPFRLEKQEEFTNFHNIAHERFAKKVERVKELETTLSHLELRMARVYMEVTGGKCSKDTPASSVIALYGEHLNERIKSAVDLETKPLVERVQQFDDHITTVANYLGAVCGGVDVGTNIPGSTAFEIIKKIKGIETQRDSILLKTEKMLESLDAINKIIFGETIVLGSPEYFKIRQLATENHSLQEYVAKRINDLESKSRERDMLAQAIKDAAVRVGIINADTELSGTHLLMLCEDLSK